MVAFAYMESLVVQWLLRSQPTEELSEGAAVVCRSRLWELLWKTSCAWFHCKRKCGSEWQYIWVGLMLVRAGTFDFGFWFPSINLLFHGRVFNFWWKFDWAYRYPWTLSNPGAVGFLSCGSVQCAFVCLWVGDSCVLCVLGTSIISVFGDFDGLSVVRVSSWCSDYFDGIDVVCCETTCTF